MIGLLLALGAAFAFSGTAFAGEVLTQKQLVEQSRAVAEVEVGFRGSDRLNVKVVRWLAGGPPRDTKVRLDRGFCLPTRANLRAWLRSERGYPRATRTLWERLSKRAGYRAIVFLGDKRRRELTYEPYCALEAMDLAHTDQHPAFGRWLKKLLGQLRLSNRRS